MFKNKYLQTIRIASCMAPNADATCRAIAAYLADRLSIATQFVDDMSWRERERQFDQGDIQLCWLCGLPYVWKADALAPDIELVAAPVMAAGRYSQQPIYFSDVVVHERSRYFVFDDLRGASWAYNEVNSHSGFNVVRYHLGRLGEPEGYFGKAVESGAHQESLRMILDGRVDASAIDSTVLENELALHPELKRHIRVIGALGPSPMPPWVMRRDLPQDFKQSLRAAFLGMGDDAAGRAILRQWGIARFVEMQDSAYHPIRKMSRVAGQVKLAA